jgi:hypothetical protein
MPIWFHEWHKWEYVFQTKMFHLDSSYGLSHDFNRGVVFCFSAAEAFPTLKRWASCEAVG